MADFWVISTSQYFVVFAELFITEEEAWKL